MKDSLVNDQFYREIAVSNTFTQEWEMEHYMELAKKYGYTVFTLVVENRHGGKNIHNVPEEIIEKMKQRFEIKL
jgi:predicted kinase